MSSSSNIEPGTETLDCSDWNVSSTLIWMGIGGVPTTDCVWEGGTDANFRGDDNVAFDSFGSPNSRQAMVEGSDSSVSLRIGQSVTINSLAVYVSVNSSHQKHSGIWSFKIMVDSVATTATCVLGDEKIDSRGGTGTVMECISETKLFVAADSTISICSLWNADRYNDDQVLADIDWAVSYSLGAPLN